MSGGITNLIKFRTLENTSKYYWKERGSTIDYPSAMIGTKTPSRFLWSKMEHLINIMEQAVSENPIKTIVDGSGNEFTADEFISAISGTKMWNFDRVMEE